MEEIIQQLKQFLGSKAKEISINGPAEIDIILNNHINSADVSAQLKEHIVEIINTNTIAKINLFDADGSTVDQFSLTQ